jgi:hypothetical protein
VIIFFSINNWLICQTTEEIKKIIEGLSWNSYRASHSYRTIFVGHDQTYYELIKEKEQSGEILFNFIDKADKTVPIHIILTQIFEPDRNFFLPLIKFYTCNYFKINFKQLAGTHFIYNGLVWESNKNGPNSINKYQIERIKHLWDLRLHKNVNSFDLDPDTIIKAVRQSDANNYGCHDPKIYENNSSDIKISELQSLIGTKYPSPSFYAIFNKLGNDSTTYYVNPSKISSISFDTDGIEFDFDYENRLRCIFIMPHYKGLLINDLKMIDSKDEIKRKLGEPKEFDNIPRYKYDWIYEKYKMLIAFGYTNRIIDLQINNGTNP